MTNELSETEKDDIIGTVEFVEFLAYRGTTYGASACVINMALVQMNAFAVFTQKDGEDQEIWASTKTDCQQFIEDRGCPRRLAMCLLEMADDESRITNVKLPQPDQVEILDGPTED